MPATKQPKISVIVPAYNAAKTIDRALQSICAQTYRNLEVVVIDDGSTDETAKCIEAFLPKIRYIHQSNAGAAAARNHGCRIATGDFLAFLDADDIWHATFNSHPSIALCYTGLNWQHEGEDTPNDWHLEGRVTVTTDVAGIFERPWLGTPSVMMRLTVFNELGGFNENLSTAEDVDLWLRTANIAPIAKMDAKTVIVFRQRDGLSSLTSTYENNLKVIDSFCKKNPSFIENNPQLVKRAKGLVYEYWGSTLLGSRNEKATKILLLALINRPSTRSLYLLTKSLLYRFTPSSTRASD